MFSVPDWYRRIRAKVFGNSSGAGWEFGDGTEFYDVFDGETCWLLFADGDFRRLQEIKDRSKYHKAAVVGVGSHTDFLRQYLQGTGIRIIHIPENRFEKYVSDIDQEHCSF